MEVFKPSFSTSGVCLAGDGSAQNALLGATEDEPEPAMGALPQREADLVPLWLALQRAAPGAPRAAARAELAAALDARRVRTAHCVGVQGAGWHCARLARGACSAMFWDVGYRM